MLSSRPNDQIRYRGIGGGDLARVDEDGFIYIVDRAKDFLKCCGEKVSCRQIEEVLLEFDELVEAAVIVIPDEVLGEAVKAFVVPRIKNASGLDERVALFCKSCLAPHHLPKQIVVLPALPKSGAGKVMKLALPPDVIALAPVGCIRQTYGQQVQDSVQKMFGG